MESIIVNMKCLLTLKQVLQAMKGGLLWTPKLGIKYVIPESQRIYESFQSQVLSLYLIPMFVVNFGFTICFTATLHYWFMVVKDVSSILAVINPLYHLMVLLCAWKSPKTFSRRSLLVAAFSFVLFYVIILRGISFSFKYFFSRLLLNYCAILMVVSTIYFQGSLLISCFLWMVSCLTTLLIPVLLPLEITAQLVPSHQVGFLPCNIFLVNYSLSSQTPLPSFLSHCVGGQCN